MFDVFDFDLPGAVTEQLERRLQSMPGSTLTEQALKNLADFQQQHKLKQGVYQLLLRQQVVYVGKAIDVRGRLEQHFWKLRGRQKLQMGDVGFCCLLLHGNWSTSANEDLLISRYKDKGQCKWNGAGFGPKDVGRERDGTEPSWFDREYPINADYECPDIPDRITLGELLQSLKRRLPFTFRYEVPKAHSAAILDLKDLPRTARGLVRAAVKALGPEWQATIFFSHIVLYRERRHYKYGQPLLCAD